MADRPRIPIAKPVFGAKEEELLLATLRSGWVTQGPRVEEFEAAFAASIGSAEAVAVSSGTAALFLSLKSQGIGRGDEVLVPSLTFIATVNAIVHCDATPVFVDVDPATYNIDADSVARALTPQTAAVIAVHQLGMPADLDALTAVTQPRGIPIIEDAACAVGSRYKGAPVGASGNLAAFSFHPRKVLVTGEGGMITLNDSSLARRLRRLRHQGMSVSDAERHRAQRVVIEQYDEIGFNFRMSDLHAALGLAQLAGLDRHLERRRAIAARYEQGLRHIADVQPPAAPDYADPNFQSYIVRVNGAGCDERDRLMDAMLSRGVVTRRGLMASHAEPCYRGAKTEGALPHTETAARETLLLPMYVELTEDDQDRVLQVLDESLEAGFQTTANRNSKGSRR